LSQVDSSKVNWSQVKLSEINEGESAASFCRQVTAWVPDMFCNFYLVKNHEMANNSTTTKAGENISKDLDSWEF